LSEEKKRQKEIIDLVAGEIQLRSKRDLIEQFIDSNLPKLKPNENVISEFESYWLKHKLEAYEKLCAEENLDPAKFAKVLEVYQFANRLPRDQEIAESLTFKPKILERKSTLERVSDKIQNFIMTFIDGMGGSV
jgi:type I restriction enzyme, R subunit